MQPGPASWKPLSAVIRGTGNMAVPAGVATVGLVLLIPLSPLLIFGWGPVPAMGIAGGAVALLVYYALGTLVLLAYLRSSRSLLRLSLAQVRLRWSLFNDILRVGLVAAVSTIATNLCIGIATAPVVNAQVYGLVMGRSLARLRAPATRPV